MKHDPRALLGSCRQGRKDVRDYNDKIQSLYNRCPPGSIDKGYLKVVYLRGLRRSIRKKMKRAEGYTTIQEAFKEAMENEDEYGLGSDTDDSSDSASQKTSSEDEEHGASSHRRRGDRTENRSRRRTRSASASHRRRSPSRERDTRKEKGKVKELEKGIEDLRR